MKTKIIKKQIKLSEVYFDEELYPRTQTYWFVIFSYAESIKAGAKFPPITLALFKGRKILVDGKHRLEAYKQLKLKKIPSEILIGLSRKQIFEQAIKRNIAHGKTLSPYEKRKLILKLRGLEYKQAEICDLIQIPMDKIDSFVAQRLVNTITGEEIIVKTPLEHLAGHTFSGNQMTKILKTQKKLSIQNQMAFLKQVRDLLKAKLINFKDKEVFKLINEIKRLLK